MSVALRTFLLQGLTMPTDEKDPDENTVDRSTPDPFAEQGWGSAADRDAAFKSLVDETREAADATKASLREWMKANGVDRHTLTAEQANYWRMTLEEGAEVDGAANSPADLGWKSKAERDRTFTSLNGRIGKLPAFEAETLQSVMDSLGIGDKETFTKDQSVQLLAAITEAEKMAKGETA
jgi:hypothetical protein